MPTRAKLASAFVEVLVGRDQLKRDLRAAQHDIKEGLAGSTEGSLRVARQRGQTEARSLGGTVAGAMAQGFQVASTTKMSRAVDQMLKQFSVPLVRDLVPAIHKAAGNLGQESAQSIATHLGGKAARNLDKIAQGLNTSFLPFVTQVEKLAPGLKSEFEKAGQSIAKALNWLGDGTPLRSPAGGSPGSQRRGKLAHLPDDEFALFSNSALAQAHRVSPQTVARERKLRAQRMAAAGTAPAQTVAPPSLLDRVQHVAKHLPDNKFVNMIRSDIIGGLTDSLTKDGFKPTAQLKTGLGWLFGGRAVRLFSQALEITGETLPEIAQKIGLTNRALWSMQVYWKAGKFAIDSWSSASRAARGITAGVGHAVQWTGRQMARGMTVATVATSRFLHTLSHSHRLRTGLYNFGQLIGLSAHASRAVSKAAGSMAGVMARSTLSGGRMMAGIMSGGSGKLGRWLQSFRHVRDQWRAIAKEKGMSEAQVREGLAGKEAQNLLKRDWMAGLSNALGIGIKTIKGLRKGIDSELKKVQSGAWQAGNWNRLWGFLTLSPTAIKGSLESLKLWWLGGKMRGTWMHAVMEKLGLRRWRSKGAAAGEPHLVDGATATEDSTAGLWAKAKGWGSRLASGARIMRSPAQGAIKTAIYAVAHPVSLSARFLAGSFQHVGQLFAHSRANLQNFAAALQQATPAVLAITAGLALPGSRAIAFDDQLRALQAATSADPKQLQALNRLLLDASPRNADGSRRIIESPRHAAALITDIARAGLGPASAKGVSHEFTALARATQTDAGLAGKYGMSILSLFGLKEGSTAEVTANAKRVAGVLATITDITAAGLPDIGEAFNTIGTVSGQAGIRMQVEDVAAMLGLAADAGLTGSEAGNTYARAILQLTQKETQDKLAELGLSAADGQGNVDIVGLLGQLGDKHRAGSLDSLTMMNSLFGAFGIKGASLLAANPAGYQQKRAALAPELAGDAHHRKAALMEGGSGGSLRQLLAQIDIILIKIGQTFETSLAPIWDWLTDTAASTALWIDANRGLVSALAMVGATVAGIVGGATALGLAVSGVLSLGAAIGPVLGLAFAVVGHLFTPMGLAIHGAIELIRHWSDLGELFKIVGGSLSRGFGSSVASVMDIFSVLFNWIGIGLTGIGTWLTDSFGPWLVRAGQNLGDAFGPLLAVGDDFKSAWQGIVNAMSAGDLQMAFDIAMASLSIAWKSLVLSIRTVWDSEFLKPFKEAWRGIEDLIAKTQHKLAHMLVQASGAQAGLPKQLIREHIRNLEEDFERKTVDKERGRMQADQGLRDAIAAGQREIAALREKQAGLLAQAQRKAEVAAKAAAEQAQLADDVGGPPRIPAGATPAAGAKAVKRQEGINEARLYGTREAVDAIARSMGGNSGIDLQKKQLAVAIKQNAALNGVNEGVKKVHKELQKKGEVQVGADA